MRCARTHQNRPERADRSADAGPIEARVQEERVTPTKLLIGQILTVFAIMVLGVWSATQWAASMLGYQS